MPTKKQKQSMRKSRSSASSAGITKRGRNAIVAAHTSNGMGRPTGNVFPTRLKRTLTYSDAYVILSTAGAVGVQQWRVNSLFDPDNTGTGHQPRGFDQLCSSAGPYTRYRVTAIRIALEFIGDNSGLMVVAAGFSDTSTIPAVAGGGLGSIACNAELPGWRSCLVPTYGGAPAMLRFSADVADIENKPHFAIISEDNFSGAYSGNPTDNVWFTLQAQTYGAGTQSLDLVAHFEFDAEFEDPILLAAS